jgi:hypothetical protein
MDMRELVRRIWYLIRQRRLDAELAEEMEFHRAMSGGRDFGNATLAREDSRAVWIWPWLESVWQDGAYALRNLRREPGFAAVVRLKPDTTYRWYRWRHRPRRPVSGV